MTKFEDNLWAHLEQEHAPELLRNVGKRRRGNTSRWLGAAAAVAVLGTAAAIAPAYFGGTPPAYAVIENPDGTVTVKIRELSKFEEVSAALREHGVPAVLLKEREGCQDVGRMVDPARWNPFEMLQMREVDDETVITIARDRIPADSTMVLAVGEMKALDTDGKPALATLMALYERDHTPSCLPPAPARPPGLPPAPVR